MIKTLKAVKFGDIKKGRQFYRRAKHYREGMTYLKRVKADNYSARYANGAMGIEHNLWTASEVVYVIVRTK